MFHSRSHSQTVLLEWDKLLKNINLDASHGPSAILVNGESLDLASIVAVARYFTPVKADNPKLQQLDRSSNAVVKGLAEGQVIYGVNTGFGGSADTRTKKLEQLQQTLIREFHYGILPPHLGMKDEQGTSASKAVAKLSLSLANEDASISVMPEAWSRGSLLIRANSLIRGHSAVRPEIVQRLVDLIQYGISPKIPMHGSISASGDLSPLSYVGAAVQGKSNIAIWPLRSKGLVGQEMTAAEAFATYRLAPIKLAAKESLAIMNGTAVSCAAAALALHDAHGLAVLSQVLTAMTVEALCGSAESFDPFFAEVRPHRGQKESAHNIFNFLKGSQFMATNETLSSAGTLRQDRYSVRTAAQWIGPVLEDLMLANEQITIESNSTTDNPLVDNSGRVLSGGNFQAKSLTSAMEKVRQSIQTLGRMHFSQCTELMNPMTNRGLPPNLVAEDPSETFLFKGIDIGIAALQSELGFLANPVGTHVQTAEMGNQALNSLALISARYTHTALDILSRLVASHLLALCQALDLRAMHANFLNIVRPQVEELTSELLIPVIKDKAKEKFLVDMWSQIQKSIEQTSSADANVRFSIVAKDSIALFIDAASEEKNDRLLPVLDAWRNRLASLLENDYNINRDAYLTHGTAAPYLGRASRRMYLFVRDDLHVPLIHTAVIGTPDPERPGDDDLGEDVPSVGTFVAILYRAIRNGVMLVPAMECLRETTPVMTNGH